jgi:hypothetical protein
MQSHTNLKKRNHSLTRATDSKDEDKSAKKIKIGTRRSRVITNVGISLDSQVSPVTATPPDSQEEKTAAQKPVRVRVKPAPQRRKRPSFFPETNNRDKKIEIRQFARQPINDIQTIKTDFATGLDSMLDKLFRGTLLAERKKFIGHFLYLLAKQYRDGDSLPEMIKAENDGVLVAATELTAKKIIYIFLSNAVAYGYEPANKQLTKFRENNLQTYEFLGINKYPVGLVPKITELRGLLAGKKYADLSLRARVLMSESDSFTDTLLQEQALENNGTEENFKKILLHHIERISKNFPNTAGHHIALFGVKIGAVLCNPHGAALPKQDPVISAPLLYAKEIVLPFMEIAASIGHPYSVAWVESNEQSGACTRSRSTIS